MGGAVMVGGSAGFSVENALLARKPKLAQRGWFRRMSGALPLPMRSGTFQNLALAVFAATVVFNAATYDYYRSSIVSPLPGGPVSPAPHPLDLTGCVLLPACAVAFQACP